MVAVNEMRGGLDAVERMTHWMNRTSARQRMVILTFDTVEAAEAWEAAGCPLSALVAEPRNDDCPTCADRLTADPTATRSIAATVT